MRRLLAVVAQLWSGLRCWSGDDAYDRYCAAHAGHDHELPSRREFYRAYFARRGARPRCC